MRVDILIIFIHVWICVLNQHPYVMVHPIFVTTL